MSTVLTSPVRFHRGRFCPVEYVQAECAGCQSAIAVPADANPPLCFDCQKAQVTADVHKLLCEIRDLRVGNGMYGLLSVEERNEQLQSLGMPAVDATPKYPGFKSVPSDVLITIVSDPVETAPYDDRSAMVAEALAELCNRLDTPTDPAPTPVEQEQLERTSVVIAGEPEDPERWDLV